jgi:hypothetical protein
LFAFDPRYVATFVNQWNRSHLANFFMLVILEPGKSMNAPASSAVGDAFGVLAQQIQRKRSTLSTISRLY